MKIKKLKFKQIFKRKLIEFDGFTKEFLRAVPYKNNSIFLCFEIYNNLDRGEEIWTAYCSIDKPGKSRIFYSKKKAETYLQKKWKKIVLSFFETK